VSIDSSVRPTVGRERELQQLEAALDALAGDASSCVVVEGEPGIGKTRLLRELRDRGEARGLLVLTGSAAEFERDVPFSVWADALDAYVAAQELEPADAGELAEILPSLRAPGATPSAVPDERYRAHRAMRGLIDQLAEDRRLVLVFDDLHWSDQASIDLIAALLRRLPDAPVLIALAFRPGQAPERLAAALAAPDVQRIALEPLSETAAAELLGGPDAGAIFRRAGGNPFYLEQLARFAPADAEAGADGTDEIPAAVVASLAEELGSLSERERALLDGAAVAGEPFEPDLAAAIGELALDEALVALDALLARDLLRPTTVPRRFRFRHPLVRGAVYDSTAAGWRLRGHARAVEALAERGAAPTELAHHVERSAARGDEDAIAMLTAAGVEAAPRGPAGAGPGGGGAPGRGAPTTGGPGGPGARRPRAGPPLCAPR
jgi:predicted ATPase